MRRKHVVTAICVAALLPLLAWNGVVQSWNDGASDVLARLLPRPHSHWRDRIVVLAIDDRTVSRYGPLPLRRDVVARGLDFVSAAKPTVLAVDLLFSEKQSPEADAALVTSLGRFSNVVLAAALETTFDSSPHPGWILPIPPLPANALGHVHASPDPDGVVRSLLLEKSDGDQKYYALGLEAARLAGSPLPIHINHREGHPMWVHYAGPEGTFPTISFADVLEGRVARDRLAGKIVLLGVSAQGGGDRRFTPVSGGQEMAGVEIHANVIRDLLDGDVLHPLSPVGDLTLLAATIVAAVLAFRKWPGRAPVVAGFVAIPVAAYAAMTLGWIVPLASWLIAYFLAAMAMSLADASLAREGRADYALRLQTIAHEIKTPLTAISASSEMVADSSIPAARKAVVAALIHKESQRLSGIVGTFLDVERISAGVLHLERKPTDLAIVASEAIERAGLLADRKHIRIETNLPPVAVSGDAELLGFAVYNLLTNALKYSPANSLVTVATESRAGSAWLTVDDRGSGIEPAERKHIFERFYRQKRHAESSLPGSGVGLALVKEIVTQHGGRIDVESQPGQGSRFTVKFPT